VIKVWHVDRMDEHDTLVFGVTKRNCMSITRKF
jgi:hypothetical protein